jgi:hypothetical protein
MKRILLLMAGVCLAHSVWAATYSYTAPAFTEFTAFQSPCVTGSCANFSPGATVSGWFTTASPLLNIPADTEISSSVTGYYFTDGINAYSSADPNSRVHMILVEADASGNIGSVAIQLGVWKSGAAPHAVGDRLGVISITTGSYSGAYNNLTCLDVGVGSTNIPDSCKTFTTDASSSDAFGPYGSWTAALIPVVGLWWNPLESGSGYNIDVKHGVMVMTVYSYNKTTGEQEWYITSGPITNGSFTGTLNRYVGGQCISCVYNGLPTPAGNAGVVTINFTSPTSATMLLPGGRVTEIQPEAF